MPQRSEKEEIMTRRLWFVLFTVFTGMVLMASGGRPLNAQEQPAPRTLTVLVSGGQDTTVFDTFFPLTLRVRVGDTVTWKFNAHPVHF